MHQDNIAVDDQMELVYGLEVFFCVYGLYHGVVYFSKTYGSKNLNI